MHKDGTNPPSLDGCSNLRHVLQSLAAKRTTKMAKKYEQEWRLIEELKQGLAGFRAVLLKHRWQWLAFTNCGRLRHAPSIVRGVSAFGGWRQGLVSLLAKSRRGFARLIRPRYAR